MHAIIQSKFELNRRFEQERTIWEWCSDKLHPIWVTRKKYRNDCLLGIAYGIERWTPQSGVSIFDLPQVFGAIDGPLFDADDLVAWWDCYPACLLEMCQGIFTKGACLSTQLETVRKEEGVNPTLDEIAEKMHEKESQRRDAWDSKGIHPTSDIHLFQRNMTVLKKRLETLIVDEHRVVEALAREILELGCQADQLPALASIRRTPENLVDKVNRFKLWLAAQEAIDHGLNEAALMQILSGHFDRIMTPAFREKIELQGYTIKDVFDDFLNFDVHKNRDEITGVLKR